MNSQDMAAYMRNRRANRRIKAIEYLGGVCTKCGTTENLEFNHKNPTQKEFPVLDLHDGPWDKMLKELDKCELLCHTHHLEETTKQWAEGFWIPVNKNLEPRQHGSVRMYTEENCRCVDCRLAKKLYRQKVITYTQIIPR